MGNPYEIPKITTTKEILQSKDTLQPNSAQVGFMSAVVIPEPVGPMRRTLLFSSSTLSSQSIAPVVPDSVLDLVLRIT